MQYRKSEHRPWWWIFNPWLYAMRRDHYYEEALDSIAELATPPGVSPITPQTAHLFEFVAGHCPTCSRQYVKDMVESQ
jgi:hypothetical protein